MTCDIKRVFNCKSGEGGAEGEGREKLFINLFKFRKYFFTTNFLRPDGSKRPEVERTNFTNLAARC